MAWRAAYSLQTLKAQLDSAYPGWLFLGFYANKPGDHNTNSAGVVTAIDIGPGGGLNIHALADRLLAVRHPNLKYIISNGRIAGAWTNWKWTKYTGSRDPHDTHIHISVGVGEDGQSRQPYDDRVQWNVSGNAAPGGMLMVDKNLLINYYQVLFGRYPDADALKPGAYIGRPADVVFQELKDSDEHKRYIAGPINRIKQLAASEQKLAQDVVDRDKVIATLKSQGAGSYTKLTDKPTYTKD